jgi:hypothetical protein
MCACSLDSFQKDSSHLTWKTGHVQIPEHGKQPAAPTQPNSITTNGRIPTTRLIPILPLQSRHLLPTQLKIKHLSILPDATRRHTLRQRHKPLLQTPAQQHLRPRLAMRRRDVLQHRIFCPLAAHERAVGLDDDVAGSAPGHDVVAGKPGVDLPLPDGEDAAGAGAVFGFEGLDV